MWLIHERKYIPFQLKKFQLLFSAEGWASTGSSGGHHGSRGHLCPSQQSIHYHQHRHEEQCPHYNEEFKYKEAPSWELAKIEIPLDILQNRNNKSVILLPSYCEVQHRSKQASPLKCGCSYTLDHNKSRKQNIKTLDILEILQ